MSRKLPDSILVAVANYYIKRERCWKNIPLSKAGIRVQEYVGKFDKQAELAAIDEAAKKKEYRVCSSAGTFWFTKGTTCLTISESTFPDATYSKLNSDQV